MIENEKDSLREYLIHTQAFYGHYRTQKENAAWFACTLYLGALLALDSFVLINGRSGLFGLLLKDAICLLILSTGYFTWHFIDTLNKHRIFASKLISSCNDVLTSLIANKVDAADTEKEIFYFSNEEVYWFPHILCLRFKEYGKDYKTQGFSIERDSLSVVMVIWTFASLVLLMFLSF